MDKLTKQFFGDAKRMQLSSQEKALLWQGISTFASAKQISLNSLEKAEGFEAIAAHMRKNPLEETATVALFSWMHFHKLTASVLIALIIVGGGGGGVAYASQAAVPGDTLYSIKVDVTEPLIDAALSFDPERRAEWGRRRIKRRLEEVEHLSSTEEFTPDRRARLEERIEYRMAKLQEHLDRVPEDHRVVMQDRVDDVMMRHQEFLIKIEDGAVSIEEVRAFNDHVGGVRNRAREKWERKAPPPMINREHVPEEIRKKREELGRPIDRMPPPHERKLDRLDSKLPLKHPLRKGRDAQGEREKAPRPPRQGQHR